MTFAFHRAPSPEQRAAFLAARDRAYHAHFWDPRCGKTKVILDQFTYLTTNDKVDALIVIAYPSDVHLVWIDELPKDLPPALLNNTKVLAWRSGRMETRRAQQELSVILTHNGPVIFTMNCEAITTKSGGGFLRRLIDRRRTMFVVDEDWATNWSARTRRLLALGRHPNVLYRRLLTGTPAEESPDDLYYPTTFLHPGVLGFSSATAFRARYTKYEEEEVAPGVFARKKGYNRRTGTHFDIKIGYQNLTELAERLARFSDRVERQGNSKIYAPRYFSLTPKQRAVYDRLRDEYLAELSGGEVPVANVLTRMTRLQMIARNYYPPERQGIPCTVCALTGYLPDGQECPACDGLGAVVSTTDLQRIDTHSPAQEALATELEYSDRPFVVWCRFQQDVTDALEAAQKIYPGKVACYDGTVHQRDREAAYHAFRAGAIQGIVATEKSGLSRGHQLAPRLRLMIYYSNEFSARDRRQSEDRGETAAGDSWYDVVDLIATDTRDLTVIESLREKRSIAALITGSTLTKWL